MFDERAPEDGPKLRLSFIQGLARLKPSDQISASEVLVLLKEKAKNAKGPIKRRPSGQTVFVDTPQDH